MNEKMSVHELIGEIRKTAALLDKNFAYYHEFMRSDFALLGKKASMAMALSQVMVDYYTALETLFLRISQFFENSLKTDEWHKDLLHKMTLDVEGFRVPVIEDATCAHLRELLRFRHFRRYYFEQEFDWDRIEMVRKKYEEVRPMVERDLDKFVDFLRNLGA